MARDFSVTLYTKYHPSDPGTVSALWPILESPLIKPVKFDSVERAKKPFTSRSYSEAAQLYDDESMLFVRGGVNSFLAFFSREMNGLSVWRFFMDRKCVEEPRRSIFIEWLTALCAEFPVFFGFGCTDEELDAKHLSIRDVPGGRMQRINGLAVFEFFQFLPGVYWLTLFGPELSGDFSSPIAELETSAEINRIDGNQTLLFLPGPPFPEDLNERVRTGKKTAAVLGQDHFFNPDNSPGQLRLPQTLKTALTSLNKSKG
jgi:hypothetical protein